MICTRCDGTGFLNLQQVDEATLLTFDATGDHTIILRWIAENTTDCSVCDCCGDGEEWYDELGRHNVNDNPYEPLPECY
jgi:hypothetical protein